MGVALSPNAVATTYSEMRPHIDETVRQFCGRCRINDIDDQHGEASLAVVQAFQDIPTCADGNFPGYVRRVVWWRLVDQYRKDNRLRDKKQRRQQPIHTGMPAPDRFNVLTFARELSQDAQVCISLAIETEKKTTILSILKSDNWGVPRIRAAFDEISAALR